MSNESVINAYARAPIEKGVPIEKDVPVPFSRQNYYPWAQLEVGDSFVHLGTFSTARSSACKQGRILGRKFISRQQQDGKARIWRIA